MGEGRGHPNWTSVQDNGHASTVIKDAGERNYLDLRIERVLVMSLDA